MSQLLDDLEALRELLSVERRWTKDAFARMTDPNTNRPCSLACNPTDAAAECWCLWGGAQKVIMDAATATGAPYDSGRESRLREAFVREFSPQYRGNIPGYNDSRVRTHKDIKDLLTRAVRRVRREEAKSK